jgi:SSS family solute:Na+ symporter/sodium/pantothenate symporter
MPVELFKYALVLFYVVVIYWLSWKGMRRTKSVSSFSIGNKDMHPVLIGVTLAASISSTATFVINPGFVYVHGFAAFLHFGIAGSLGIMAAFIVLTRGFLRHGEAHQALTIPQWIYYRYNHRGFSLFFAFLNLLSITFVVLILVGCSLLVTGLFDIEQKNRSDPCTVVCVLLCADGWDLRTRLHQHDPGRNDDICFHLFGLGRSTPF